MSICHIIVALASRLRRQHDCMDFQGDSLFYNAQRGKEMTKRFLTPILLIVLSVAGYSQPKISVDSSSVIDVGSVYNTGDHVVRTFHITNSGDQPLRITQVRTSCGCTVALPSDSLIQPGRKSEIKVDFNPSGYGGDVTKNIYVMSNDPANQMITLQLKVHISYALKSNPDFIFFPNPMVGNADTSAVILTNISNETIEITGIETNSKEMSSHVDETSLKPDENTRLQLYLVGERAGPLYGEIIVHTSSKLQPTLAVRYYAEVIQK